MTPKEIEQEVKKYRKRNVGYDDDFGYHFEEGLEYMNERQHYTESDMESFAAWVSLGYSIEPEESNGERGLVYYENGTFNYLPAHTNLYTITDLLKIWKDANK